MVKFLNELIILAAQTMNITLVGVTIGLGVEHGGFPGDCTTDNTAGALTCIVIGSISFVALMLKARNAGQSPTPGGQ